METVKTLIRTDKNGTKYWNVVDVCSRCGGRGDYILGNFNYGVCFSCNGTGKRQYIWKERTPEYEAKLEAKRKAKEAKRLEEKVKYEAEHVDEIAEENRRIIERRYADNGCGKNGIGYVLTGKTFSIKDEIKKNGGRWIYGTWVCPVEIKGNGIFTKEINLNGHIGSGSEMWLDNFDFYEAIHG